MANTRQRVPKLKFTAWRNLGWHVSFRDKGSGIPRKHRFNLSGREHEAKARVLYHAWVHEHLGGEQSTARPTQVQKHVRPVSRAQVMEGSLYEVGSGLIATEKHRTRGDLEPRRRGTIEAAVCRDRTNKIYKFLDFLNTRHGVGAVGKMRLADLSMEDVEAFNRTIVLEKYSASQVSKHLQIVKAIIDRAGRPEHGQQVLSWNWDSRDVSHGTPTEERILPSKEQILKLVESTDLRGQTMIWLGIGLGFGARDLTAIRVGQIAKDSYDLRRSKTGVERFGKTPPRVWSFVSKFQASEKRETGQLLFVTRNGNPLVHSTAKATTNAVTQWWTKLRDKINEEGDSLAGGFYTLRHLGATEFGSRPGTSIGEVKRWLGHSISSDVADLYMRPVRPEFSKVVKWVRSELKKA